MEYVEWCELVLQVMGKAAEDSAQIRNYGIDCDSLGKRVWAEHYAQVAENVNAQDRDNILYDAICDLDRNLLIDDPNATFLKLTREGRKAAKDLFPVWENACDIRLEPAMERALSIINRHSNESHQYFGRANYVPMNTVHCELDEQDLTEEDVWELLAELKALDLTYWDDGDYADEIRSTYRGLTWETRRDQVIGVRFVDSLVAEWETTSVEFKRELHLDTADQKAEFIKDVTGLGNTQASGRRWLIIGLDDKTRTYYSSPDPAIRQDRIENILARYTKPNLDVRYSVIPYRNGKVGVVEVLRDPKKLPYKVAKSLGTKVAKSLGTKCRITENQIFVRHGSQTESPTDAELDAICKEAERAQSRDV